MATSLKHKAQVSSVQQLLEVLASLRDAERGEVLMIDASMRGTGSARLINCLYCLIIQYYEYTPFDAVIEVICIYD